MVRYTFTRVAGPRIRQSRIARGKLAGRVSRVAAGSGGRGKAKSTVPTCAVLAVRAASDARHGPPDDAARRRDTLAGGSAVRCGGSQPAARPPVGRLSHCRRRGGGAPRAALGRRARRGGAQGLRHVQGPGHGFHSLHRARLRAARGLLRQRLPPLRVRPRERRAPGPRLLTGARPGPARAQPVRGAPRRPCQARGAAAARAGGSGVLGGPRERIHVPSIVLRPHRPTTPR